jgi:hypothetical protein
MLGAYDIFCLKGRKKRLDTSDEFSRMMSKSTEEIEREMDYGAGRMLSTGSTLGRSDTLGPSRDTLQSGISSTGKINISVISNVHFTRVCQKPP